MNALVLSPKAKTDLSHIWEYTCAEWGVGQAEQYVRCLWEAMEEQTRDLTKSVDMGHVRKGYRKIRSGSHLIFFKVTREGRGCRKRPGGVKAAKTDRPYRGWYWTSEWQKMERKVDQEMEDEKPSELFQTAEEGLKWLNE